MYFVQLLGTAMGTSAACMWATIYYSVHESGVLLPRYGHCLPLLRRFIDDLIGIWTGTDTEWEQFKRDVNNFGILTWDIEDPSDSKIFLDLTITIARGRIVTTTYQKDEKLPPPKSYTSDYHSTATKLFDRHVARGWDRATMRSYIPLMLIVSSVSMCCAATLPLLLLPTRPMTTTKNAFSSTWNTIRTTSHANTFVQSTVILAKTSLKAF